MMSEAPNNDGPEAIVAYVEVTVSAVGDRRCFTARTAGFGAHRPGSVPVPWAVSPVQGKPGPHIAAALGLLADAIQQSQPAPPTAAVDTLPPAPGALQPARPSPYPVQQPPPPVAPARPFPQPHAPMPPGPPVQQAPGLLMVHQPWPTVAVKGPNHVLHLLLTVITGGLWLPVWLIIALRDKPRLG